MAVLERVPHHEEREEQKQFQHLETGEFTVMPFLNSNAGEIEVQAGDCTDYTINGPVTIIFREKWAHLQSSVFKLSKNLIDSIHEEGIVAYTS